MNRNNLSDLFDTEDKITELSNNKVLIVDGNNLAMRTVFSIIFRNPEDQEQDYKLWKHLFMNSIFSLITKFQPQRLILAFDSRNSWRYSVYQDYKLNRKAAKADSKLDFDKFFPIFEQLKTDFQNTFTNIPVFKVDRAEGDDIIAVISKKIIDRKYQVIIVSTDKDFAQLLSQDNIRQFDPLKNTFIKNINYKKDLEIKILTGDVSDNIKPIRKGFGPKTAMKVLDEGTLLELLEQPENILMKENYTRNTTLINFDCIPKEIEENIVSKYNEYQYNPIEKTKLMQFFMKHNLNKLMLEWQNYSESVRELV